MKGEKVEAQQLHTSLFSLHQAQSSSFKALHKRKGPMEPNGKEQRMKVALIQCALRLLSKTMQVPQTHFWKETLRMSVSWKIWLASSNSSITNLRKRLLSTRDRSRLSLSSRPNSKTWGVQLRWFRRMWVWPLLVRMEAWDWAARITSLAGITWSLMQMVSRSNCLHTHPWIRMVLSVSNVELPNKRIPRASRGKVRIRMCLVQTSHWTVKFFLGSRTDWAQMGVWGEWHLI